MYPFVITYRLFPMILSSAASTRFTIRVKHQKFVQMRSIATELSFSPLGCVLAHYGWLFACLLFTSCWPNLLGPR